MFPLGLGHQQRIARPVGPTNLLSLEPRERFQTNDDCDITENFPLPPTGQVQMENRVDMRSGRISKILAERTTLMLGGTGRRFESPTSQQPVINVIKQSTISTG